MSVERITLEPVGELDALEHRWRTLEAACDCSFFQSWTFLGCDAGRRLAGARLLCVTQDGVDVALGLLGSRHGRFWLNETGVPSLDAVFIEHNGLLVRDGQSGPEIAAFRHALRYTKAVVLSGVNSQTLEAARQAGWAVMQQSRLAPCVTLHALNKPFVETLSANARAQIRRAIRTYGPGLQLARAETVQQAHEWFGQMVQLHQESWIRRGKPGAFATEQARGFHTALIARGWKTGEVDLLRITAEGRIVGVLYLFVRGGRVLSYQSGFAYDLGHARQKPGLVCHTLAIEHYAAHGARIYDLLAGADRYKLTLAPSGETLHWATLYARMSPRGVLGVAKDRVRRIRDSLRGA